MIIWDCQTTVKAKALGAGTSHRPRAHLRGEQGSGLNRILQAHVLAVGSRGMPWRAAAPRGPAPRPLLLGPGPAPPAPRAVPSPGTDYLAARPASGPLLRHRRAAAAAAPPQPPPERRSAPEQRAGKGGGVEAGPGRRAPGGRKRRHLVAGASSSRCLETEHLKPSPRPPAPRPGDRYRQAPRALAGRAELPTNVLCPAPLGPASTGPVTPPPTGPAPWRPKGSAPQVGVPWSRPPQATPQTLGSALTGLTLLAPQFQGPAPKGPRSPAAPPIGHAPAPFSPPRPAPGAPGDLWPRPSRPPSELQAQYQSSCGRGGLRAPRAEGLVQGGCLAPLQRLPPSVRLRSAAGEGNDPDRSPIESGRDVCHTAADPNTSKGRQIQSVLSMAEEECIPRPFPFPRFLHEMGVDSAVLHGSSLQPRSSGGSGGGGFSRS
ncbi:basic proline-rich protein-like [Meriones unguiculatus]|uniref:basic proline-rich protein-like n=1 Tax=Meriones unguiculatus TaxID=10047 RepID=UPI00293E8097|nr:basic proline-rich protein-like [Meriones unguiculatus]